MFHSQFFLVGELGEYTYIVHWNKSVLFLQILGVFCIFEIPTESKIDVSMSTFIRHKIFTLVISFTGDQKNFNDCTVEC